MQQLKGKCEVIVCDNVYLDAAKRFSKIADEAIQRSGRFTVALSGGETPVPLFRELAQKDLPWSKFFIFWTDERNVPLLDAESNYRLAKENFLDHVSVPSNQIFPYQTELPSPSAIALDYEATIRAVVVSPHDGPPRFDLALLGVGEDGHTASLFSTEHLKEESLVLSPWVEKLGSFRFSFSPKLLNLSRNIFILAVGKEKNAIVRDVLAKIEGGIRYPVEMIRPENGRLYWFLDHAAALRQK